MSRVASLQTPQRRNSPTPSSSPARGGQALEQSSSSAAAESSRAAETRHHRMLRQVVQEFGATVQTWDEIVKSDGLKAGSGVINESTEMDNLLALPGDVRPPIQPRLEALHTHRQALSSVIAKLAKLLKKLSALVEHAEAVYFEAYDRQTLDLEAPLWCTWTMTHFIDSMIAVLSLHVSHLDLLRALSDKILDPSTPFDDAKAALERWRDLAYAGHRRRGVLEWQEMLWLEMGQAADPQSDRFADGLVGPSPGGPVSGGKAAKQGRRA